MVKAPPKQPTEVAKPTTAVAKPAPAQPIAWPTQQDVTDLAWVLDRLYPKYQEVLDLLEKLATATSDWSRRQITQQAQKVIEYFENSGYKNRVKNGRLQKLWDECRPDSWYNDDAGPVYSEVARMITVLMGSFPTSKIPEPEIFVRVLLDDVMALEPSFVELESTCRHLRQTQKFMPSISEVVGTLKEQQNLWCRRGRVVEFAEENYIDLCAEIARAKAAEDRKAAKSQPIVAGDRVHNWRAGAGTVTALVPLDDGVMHYRVRFDASTERNVPGAKYLERLVAGDEGFEPAAAPMVEHRKDVPMAPIASPAGGLDANGDKVGVPADRSRETRNGEDD